MLADLERHEECPYGPGIVAHHALDARPVFGRPLTARMRFEADALDAQAVELERQTPSRSGSATGTTVAEVLAAAQADPFVIAPRLDVLEAKANELDGRRACAPLPAPAALRQLRRARRAAAPRARLAGRRAGREPLPLRERGGGRMSRSDEVSRAPRRVPGHARGGHRLAGPPASVTGETALEIRRSRVRAALREIAREDAARERGLDPKTAKTR